MRSDNVGRILQQLARRSRETAVTAPRAESRTRPVATRGYGRRTTPTTAATGGGLGRMVTRFHRSR